MKVLTSIAYGTAILLAAFSGSVATYGLTKFAPGAELVIAVMGVLFEATKLTAFAMLHVRMPIALKGALVLIGLVLMTLNIVGVSGFLSNHYEKQAITAHAATHAVKVETGANVAVLKQQLASAEARVDKATESLGKAKGDRDQIRAVNALIAAASKERDGVAAQLVAAQGRDARAEGSAIEATGEFAAVVFVANALHTDKDQVAHYVLLGIASLPDVAAVLLLIGAGYAAQMRRALVVETVVEPSATIEPEPETIAPQVVEEVPVKVEDTPQLTKRHLAARQAANTRKVNAMVAQKQKEHAIRKGVATRKRNARARAKARANGPKLVAK